MNALFDLLNQYQRSNYRIVSSNTGTGVYKNDGPYDVYIYVKNVPDLFAIKKTDSVLTLGAELSLNKLIEVFDVFCQSVGFEYLSEISAHLRKIANVSVRNVATWAGNLMLKYKHLDFASDVFICFETIKASIKLVGPDQHSPPVLVSPLDLLTTPVNGKLIYSLDLKPFSNANTIIKTFKIMPRSQNSHAYVNAGFNFTFDPATLIVLECSMVFGGLSRNFVHASQTESFLLKKPLNDEKVLAESFQILFNELITDNDPVLSASSYRKSLAVSLFYKYLLFVNKNTLSPRLQSAFDNLIEARALSSGKQDFPTNPSTFPVSKPMSKLNA
jgi:xanthine dehydrogenase/oxidase